MDIQILGAGQEVGRSGILLKGSKNILLDYGIKVEAKVEYPLPAGPVDAFVLSHAHLDHSGFSPALYHQGMPAAFGTEPTRALAELLIEDSIELNKKKHAHPKFKKTESGLSSTPIPPMVTRRGSSSATMRFRSTTPGT